MNPEQRLNDGNRQHFPEDVGVTKGGGIAGAEGMYDYVKPWPGGAEGSENLPRNFHLQARCRRSNVSHLFGVRDCSSRIG